MIRGGRVRPIVLGVLGAAALLAVYFLVMGLGSGSFGYALSELVRLKYWIGPLILGFGIQVGLFSYLKSCAGKVGSGSMMTSSATSTTAMVACCAHHLTDILPILGLSAVTTFLARYQEWFLALGILSNMVGIILMLRLINSMNKA